MEQTLIGRLIGQDAKPNQTLFKFNIDGNTKLVGCFPPHVPTLSFDKVYEFKVSHVEQNGKTYCNMVRKERDGEFVIREVPNAPSNAPAKQSLPHSFSSEAKNKRIGRLSIFSSLSAVASALITSKQLKEEETVKWIINNSKEVEKYIEGIE